MSLTTVAQHNYEIREGLTNFGAFERPFIDGVVDGQAVVTAFEIPLPTEAGRLSWMLFTYGDVAGFAEVGQPAGTFLASADEARQWVKLVTSLYAKAIAAVNL